MKLFFIVLLLTIIIEFAFTLRSKTNPCEKKNEKDCEIKSPLDLVVCKWDDKEKKCKSGSTLKKNVSKATAEERKNIADKRKSEEEKKEASEA
mmetsp:Transcript_36190/g.37558  ORF Transcript_36190/g.37558 Transcript_36190/m.37558 type:complete len:93 (+) Transcript_36190:55-333(+)